MPLLEGGVVEPVYEKSQDAVVLQVRQRVHGRLLNLRVRVVQTVDQGDGGRGIAPPSQGEGGRGPRHRVGAFQDRHQLFDQLLRRPEKGGRHAELNGGIVAHLFVFVRIGQQAEERPDDIRPGESAQQQHDLALEVRLAQLEGLEKQRHGLAPFLDEALRVFDVGARFLLQALPGLKQDHVVRFHAVGKSVGARAETAAGHWYQRTGCHAVRPTLSVKPRRVSTAAAACPAGRFWS